MCICVQYIYIYILYIYIYIYVYIYRIIKKKIKTYLNKTATISKYLQFLIYKLNESVVGTR